jgi:transposase
MDKLPEVFIGVDVSKDNLDIHIYPKGLSLKIENSKKDIRKFINNLKTYDVKQISCESTGGYEMLLQKELQEKQYNLWIVDPRRVKGFVAASGCKTKTDKIDAKKIAEFTVAHRRDYMPVTKSENQIKLQAFVNRRNDLVEFLASEKTRTKHPVHQASLDNINKHIDFLKGEVDALDKVISKIIKSDTTLSKQEKILYSVPGFGIGTISTLLSFVPELGSINNSKVAALVGLCPYDNQSGNYHGKKFIRGGREIPRKILYMSALTAIKHNPRLKEFYERLIAKGKPFKLAIVAVMRKLIVLANTLLRKEESYVKLA